MGMQGRCVLPTTTLHFGMMTYHVTTHSYLYALSSIQGLSVWPSRTRDSNGRLNCPGGVVIGPCMPIVAQWTEALPIEWPPRLAGVGVGKTEIRSAMAYTGFLLVRKCIVCGGTFNQRLGAPRFGISAAQSGRQLCLVFTSRLGGSDSSVYGGLAEVYERVSKAIYSMLLLPS